MSTEESVQDRVHRVIKDTLVLENDPANDQTLRVDLDAGSLDLQSLMMALEDEFNKSMPDDCMAEINTVGDVVGYVESQLSRR